MICPFFFAFLLKIFFTWPVLAVGLPIALQMSGMYTGIPNSCYINIEKTWQGDLLFSSTSLTLQLEEKGRQPKSVVKAKRPRTMPPAGKEGGREEGGGQLALTASCTSVKVALAAWRLLPRLPIFQLIRPV